VAGRTPVPALVLGSVISIQAGHAYGKLLFGLVPPMGVATLRLGFAALVLGLVWRPRLPVDRRTRLLVIGCGTAIAGMQTIYPALERLPVGAAVTLQFLGPLTVALAGSRRLLDLVCAVLAGTGVLLFYPPGDTDPSVVGILFAVASGASWAAYIVLTQRLGARSGDGSLLALAVIWAAALTVPAGIAVNGPDLAQPSALLSGLGLAVLSAVIPWSLDLATLRRLSSRVFGVLVSLEPPLGALAGLLVLGERLTPTQCLATGCVVAASIGVSTTRPPTGPGGGRGHRRLSMSTTRLQGSRTETSALSTLDPVTPRRSPHGFRPREPQHESRVPWVPRVVA
jgi:inner membrane transporter RhtA